MKREEAIKDLDIIRFNPHWDELVNEEYWQELMEMSIKALEEVQQYQALEKRLSDMFGGSLSLKMCVDELERILTEPDSPHPMNAKILTYQEAADWEAYRAIGTPEECRAAVEKQTAKKVKSISQVKDGDSYVGLIGRCPCCGDILEEDTVYCDCGQKLDWRNEE